MDKERQIFKMVKDGFDNLAKSIGSIKMPAPMIMDHSEMVKKLDETNTILSNMLAEDKKEKDNESIEVTLKIE